MASTYLSRTNGTATNRKIFTWSTWIKRANISNNQALLSTRTDGSNQASIRFESDRFDVYELSGGSYDWYIKTNRLFRDTSAWYHIVFTYDSTQATNTNRLKIYVNGVQETSYQQVSYPSLNYETDLTSASTLYLGQIASGDYFDGSMAHVHYIDGTAYDASAFGETDATTGIWKPKTAPSVTYGTNGFFLKMENSGSMGTDSSGNGNNFSVSGNLTQTVDTPSNIFATLNGVARHDLLTLSNGNLFMSNNSGGHNGIPATLGVSKGKYYWEVKHGTIIVSSKVMAGIVSDSVDLYGKYVGQPSEGYAYYSPNGVKYNNASNSAYGNSWTTNDIISVAFDATNGTIWFAKNGTWQNSATQNEIENGTTTNAAFSGLDTTKTWLPAVSCEDCQAYINFGNGYFGTTAVSSAQSPDDGIGIFEYTVPTGYKALCTKSINAQEYA